MVKDVIDGIKQTEAEAAAIVEAARKKKAEIIAKAREEARAHIEVARSQGAETLKLALGEAQEEAKRRTQEIASREKTERERLREASTKRIAKAVDTVIERMLS